MIAPVHRLVIVSSNFRDQAVSAPFYSEEAACEEAARYLRYNPKDLVMLVELELAICKHCEQYIIEKAGWILHKWIHLLTGAHLCHLKFTQAEPKEEE